MDKKNIVLAFFVLCLLGFMTGSVETSGDKLVPRVVYGLQIFGIIALGCFSERRLAVFALLVIGVVASLIGGWGKEIRYYLYFATAFLLGHENGAKYPDLFLKIFVPYATLSGLVMLAQTLALSPVFYLWDNSAFFYEKEEIETSFFSRYQTYQDFKLENPFFEDQFNYSITQGRPCGLTYANNLTCSLLLLGSAGLYMLKKNIFPKAAYLFLIPIVLSGGLLSIFGLWLLTIARLLLFKKQKNECLLFLVWLIGVACLYTIVFPGLAEGRNSSEKIVSSFTNRALSFLESSSESSLDTVEHWNLIFLEKSNIILYAIFGMGSFVFLFLSQGISRFLPNKNYLLQKTYPLIIYLITIFFVPMHRNLGTYFFLGYLFGTLKNRHPENPLRN